MINQPQDLPTTSGVVAAINGASASRTPRVAHDISSARQETQIWTTYALNPYLRVFDIKVTVIESCATLSGTVAEEANKDLAQEIALSVKGIKSVDNRLEVVAQFVPPPRTDHRAFGELVDDTTVTSAVRSKLAWSRYADGLRASVTSTRGQVTLTGYVTTAEGKNAAAKLALSTHGVQAVTNELDIQPGVVTSIGGDLADGWITSKVRSTFLYSSYVAGRDIEVDTQKGVVKLSGKIGSETERALAIELAGNVRGVKGVDSSALTM
jgi:hyperosmotically inducible periplasmic protein